MKIKDAKFIKSVFIDDEKVMFEQKNEIIFIWRSNVGKSSLMNALMERKGLVKTSSRPWKTITANLFLVNNKYFYTDLPGYWFAKLWKDILEKLDALISWYIEERAPHIKKVLLLVDTKIWLQQKDIDMYNYVQELKIPIVIVLSKIDRLSKSEVQKAKNHIQKELFGQKLFAVSSSKKLWLKELSRDIREALEEKSI